MKKWVFFDMMGVVFKVGDDTNELLVPFIKERNKTISSEKINELYLKASLGEISSKEFWTHVGLKEQYPQIEKLYLDTCLKLDENVLEVFGELSKEYNIGLISNDVNEWSEYLRQKYDLDRWLSSCVISGKIGHRKPDKYVYTLAIDQLREPQDAVFIDDRIKNLYPAEEMGMIVIKFNREDQYDSELKMPQTNTLLDIPEIVEICFKKEN